MIEAVAERSAELEGLCRRFHVGRLALFGSAARGVHDPDRSDLDFSVEFQPAALDDYANTYFGLLEALETLFEAPVDLVVHTAIKNRYFLRSVNETSRVLYEA